MLAISNETEGLVRKIALKTGKTPEDVIKDVVEASARSFGVAEDASAIDCDAMITEANEIALWNAALPILDTRSDDEILGYDEFGVPN